MSCWANTALLERAEEDRDFVTVGCVTFSPKDGGLRWGYAGHPPVLWLDTGEELYTDGVTEARHNGEQFGQTRLAQIVQALGGQSPPEVVAAVTTEVQQFAATGLVDDLCVVAARTAEG